MKQGTIEEGAKQAINYCLRVQPREKVVIITDEAKYHLADALFTEAEKITPGNIQIFSIEDFGDRDKTGKSPLKFPEEIKGAMEKCDVSIYVALAYAGEIRTFRHPMFDVIMKSKHIRHGHMIGISDEIMQTGMCANYEEIGQLTTTVYNAVKGAQKIRVTTPAGTDFTVDFDPNYKWIPCDGVVPVGSFNNLPEGEVYTCIKNIIKGVIVVDGVLGAHFSEKYGAIDKTPVTLQIENGRVVSINCAHDELKEELIEHMKDDENANRIGEFAIGTLASLEKLVGNLLQDEKFPGVHVSIGHGYPELTGADWNSVGHIDAVLKCCTIEVDGKLLMKDGKFIV